MKCMRTWIVATSLFIAGTAFGAEVPQPEKGKEVEAKKESARPTLSDEQVKALKALGLSTEKFMKFGVRKDAENKEEKR